MKKNILVADDNLYIRESIKNLLCSDYNVIEANDGEIAWDLLVSNAESINAAIIDWKMPITDGIELISRMKSDEKLKKVPVIMVSAKTDPEDISAGLHTGVFQYLTKPFEETILLAMVKSALSEYEKEKLNKIREDEISRFQVGINKLIQQQDLDLKTARAVNKFFIASLNCTNYEELTQLLLDTTKIFEFSSSNAHGDREGGSCLRCSVRVRSERDVDLTDRGILSRLDIQILDKAIQEGQILKQGRYTAIPSCSGVVGILVRNTPTKMAENKLALKFLLVLLEMFENRLLHFEKVMKIRTQKQELEEIKSKYEKIVRTSISAFNDVNKKYKDIKDFQMSNWKELLDSIDDESPVKQNVIQAMENATQSYKDDRLIDDEFYKASRHLASIFN